MIINSLVIGKASKSAGGLTVQNWKGLTVGRQKPTDVANPNTQPQQLQRSKMRSTVKLFRALSSIINLGFSQLAIKMSAYNAFASSLLKANCWTGDGEIESVNLHNVKFAKGTLKPGGLTSAALSNGNSELTLTGTGVASGDQQGTDTLNVVVLSNNGVVKASYMDIAYRSDTDTTVVAPAGVVFATNDKVFYFYYQPSSRKVSDSSVVAFV